MTLLWWRRTWGPSVMTLLEVDGLGVWYQRVQAVAGVDICVDSGQVVALLGANGAGKTTILRAISGLKAPAEGVVRFSGVSISGLSADRVARLGVAHVPEGRHVFPGLSVRDNLLLGTSSRRAPKEEVQADLARVFDLFPDLAKRPNVLGWTLSGGQQQMVAVARALMARPRLLLLDEPSLGLAPIVVAGIFGALDRLRESGTTILLVEQNSAMALEIADYAYVLEVGHVVLKGSASDLRDDPRIVGAYLGGYEAVAPSDDDILGQGRAIGMVGE